MVDIQYLEDQNCVGYFRASEDRIDSVPEPLRSIAVEGNALGAMNAQLVHSHREQSFDLVRIAKRAIDSFLELLVDSTVLIMNVNLE
mgnify:CR=1 FL=1